MLYFRKWERNIRWGHKRRNWFCKWAMAFYIWKRERSC